ncbi:sensor histidine kinase [Pelagicoccus sp. SDUM812005]|uniref:sensor histidine kinase n=1 Tax=Pelagicoccus sp. SDUM812005 TaxID=3041257 RepID=UPI00280FE004|nr:sensor histidine kinase [Pelagicoccus sp. SDUM812005]MDQ8181107.1 sensor histidine kinase [Pelagicoccus sp. SDUM812005]
MPHNAASRYTLVSSLIDSEEDLAASRRWAKLIAEKLGLDPSTQTRLSTAVSEVSRNALSYGGGGRIVFQLDTISNPQELAVFVEDDGTQPDEVQRRILSRKGLGVGLSGSRRLVSRLEVDASKGGGTLVKLYLTLPDSLKRFTLNDASNIRDEILSSGDLNPLAELKRQNQELLASLQLIENQKQKLAQFNKELREAEERQRRTAEKMQAILENLPDSIVLYGPDCEFEYSNGPAKTLASLGESDVPFGLDSVFEEAIKSGKDYFPEGPGSLLQEKVNGEDRYFLPRVINFLGSGGTARGALLLLRDVTDMRLLDDLKMDLLGTLSHEIKGPVTSIRMAVLLLLDRALGELNDDQKELAETAKSEIERLLRLLNNLLDVQRFSSGGYSLQRVYCTVADVVARSTSEMRRDAEKRGIALEDRTEQCSTEDLFVDQERIIYALNNLLSNAIKHSESGQTVTLTAERDASGKSIRLGVRDEGSGIPKRYQQLIFNRYAKAPGNRRPGIGLGLTIARDFARAHGGDIGVESDEGKGSHFYIELPLGREEVPED